MTFPTPMLLSAGAPERVAKIKVGFWGGLIGFMATANPNAGIYQAFGSLIDDLTPPLELIGFFQISPYSSSKQTVIFLEGNMLAHLTGKSLYINGVSYPFPTGNDYKWRYISYYSWTECLYQYDKTGGGPVLPTLSNNQTYSIEIK